MGLTPLPDDKILIGQGIDDADPPPKKIANIAGGVFAGNCPLWTYVLAEAMQNRAKPEPIVAVTEANKTVGTPQLARLVGGSSQRCFLGCCLRILDRILIFRMIGLRQGTQIIS